MNESPQVLGSNLHESFVGSVRKSRLKTCRGASASGPACEEVTGYYLACQRTSRSDSLSRNSSALYSCTLARERRDRTGFLTRLAVSSSYGSHFQKSVNCAAIGSCCQQFESCGKESSAAALGAYLHPNVLGLVGN